MKLVPQRKHLILFTVPLAALLLAAGVVLYVSLRDLPDIGDVKSAAKNQTTYIYAVDGSPIASLFHENRTIIPFSRTSRNLRNAILAVEDARFYRHSGVDYIRILGAFVQDIKGLGATQGGSTITQQYVRTAYLSREKTLSRKFKEALFSIVLERSHSKEQIFEMYLNTVYFGSGAYGVEAAAQQYFGIPAQRLSLEQGALLAGLIQSPERYDPYTHPDKAIEKRNLVLDLMAKEGLANADAVETAKTHPIIIAPQQNFPTLAPYFVAWIKSETSRLGISEKELFASGLRIYTTLDPEMQRSAERAWRKYLSHPANPDLAIVAADPSSGAVKAMVGGKDFTTQKLNLATQGKRQPGSAFKPIVLATALMNGVSPDAIYDAGAPQVFRIPGTRRTWKVRNYDSTEAGNMSLKEATVNSVNVVYAKLILDVGIDKVVRTAKELGIKSRVNHDPWIALGGLRDGVTPLEMAGAYSVFANNGIYNEPFGITTIKTSTGQVIYRHDANPKRVIDHAVTHLVTDALREVIRSGTGKDAAIGRPAAGKTGTNQDYVDAWFCGYTPDLVASVWVGYKDRRKPMTNVRGICVTGGTFPARIWSSFMRAALKDTRPRDFTPPPSDSLTHVLMDPQTGRAATEFCPDARPYVFVRRYCPRVIASCDVHTPVEVPQLMGLKKAEAITRLIESGLAYYVQYKALDQPVDVVVDQYPKAGSRAATRSAVALTINKGDDGSEPSAHRLSVRAVPNVIGLDANQATTLLQEADFKVNSEYRPDTESKNRVIGQDPPPGATANADSIVTLAVGYHATPFSSRERQIVVDKSDFKLRFIVDGLVKKTYDIAIGKDSKITPVGEWIVGEKLNENPTGDFGPNRLLLYCFSDGEYKSTAYGIHGTKEPWVIGTKASHGCVRLTNKDILELWPQVNIGDRIVIQE